jgi:hypothetical protein
MPVMLFGRTKVSPSLLLGLVCQRLRVFRLIQQPTRLHSTNRLTTKLALVVWSTLSTRLYSRHSHRVPITTPGAKCVKHSPVSTKRSEVSAQGLQHAAIRRRRMFYDRKCISTGSSVGRLVCVTYISLQHLVASQILDYDRSLGFLPG